MFVVVPNIPYPFVEEDVSLFCDMKGIIEGISIYSIVEECFIQTKVHSFYDLEPGIEYFTHKKLTNIHIKSYTRLKELDNIILVKKPNFNVNKDQDGNQKITGNKDENDDEDSDVIVDSSGSSLPIEIPPSNGIGGPFNQPKRSPSSSSWCGSFEEIGCSGGADVFSLDCNQDVDGIGINNDDIDNSNKNKLFSDYCGEGNDNDSGFGSSSSWFSLLVFIQADFLIGEAVVDLFRDVVNVVCIPRRSSYVSSVQSLSVIENNPRSPSPRSSHSPSPTSFPDGPFTPGLKELHQKGTLCLTNRRVIFLPDNLLRATLIVGGSNKKIDWERLFQFKFGGQRLKPMIAPLACISRVEKLEGRSNGMIFGGGSSECSLEIHFKDIRRKMKLSLDGSDLLSRCSCVLNSLLFPSPQQQAPPTPTGRRTPQHILGIPRSFKGDEFDDGWGLYDPHEEYLRQGVTDPDSHWRFTDANCTFDLCPTYSDTLVVPKDITDSELAEIARFRSKGRIPVLSWRCKNTKISLTRSSQPRTGFSRSFRFKADERLVDLIRETNPHNPSLQIMDARPMANALLNTALGGGYESTTHYNGCNFEFLGIGNIHAVRDSYQKLRELCENYFDGDSATFGGQLDNTLWLSHISTLLKCAVRMIHLMHSNQQSVFVHCSDGWDRTAQLCSLAQLMLDPFFRTLRGFSILIEKEWLHFGHKFGERFGHTAEAYLSPSLIDGATPSTSPPPPNSTLAQEISPVFIQFLDAVWQIHRQFPTAFEFSEDFLISLVQAVYSAHYGTFLLNSHKERCQAGVSNAYPSFWTTALRTPKHFNPFYRYHHSFSGQKGSSQEEASPEILIPLVDGKHLSLWKGCYLRDFVDEPEYCSDPKGVLAKHLHGKVQNLSRKLNQAHDEITRLTKLLKKSHLEHENQEPQEHFHDEALFHLDGDSGSPPNHEQDPGQETCSSTTSPDVDCDEASLLGRHSRTGSMLEHWVQIE